MKNSSRVRLAERMKDFAKSVPEGAIVLDAGSGDSPYAMFFQDTRYISTDLMRTEKDYTKPSFVADLAFLPIMDAGVDFILFNQVIEHLEDPSQALDELQRVLKPEGKLFFSGPLFYEEHETPYDFQRFTQYGLRNIFKKHGFDIEKLDWLEGYFGTVAYQFNGMFKHLPLTPREIQENNPAFYLWLLLPFFLLVKNLGWGISPDLS